MKNTNQETMEWNTEYLSRIYDVENSKCLKHLDNICNYKNGNNNERNQWSVNSINNINSPNFKINSLIEDSEVKYMKRIINDIRIIFLNDNLSWEFSF